MFLNGFRVQDALYITADLDNSDPHAYVRAAGPGVTLGAYLHADLANLEAALAAFIAETGYPWISVGSLASMPWTNGTHGVIAVNLDATGFSMSDSGSGIYWYGSSPYASFGYEPGTDFASAQAIVQSLQGNTTWTPSS